MKPRNIGIAARWAAPEDWNADSKPTSKCDVWSFGIMMWELFSNGDEPWEKVRGKIGGKIRLKKKNNYKQQKESFESLKQKIHNNVRLPKPSKCSQIIYESLILPCWKLKISERPTIRVQKRKPTKKWDHVNLIFVSNFQNILSVFESVDIIRKILDIEDVAKVKDSDLSEDKSVKLKSSIEYEIAENNSYSRLKSDWVLYDESDTRPKNVTAPNLGYAKQIRRPKSNFKH